MVLNRETGTIQHTVFRDIDRFLNPGDILVVNETRVIPARLYAQKIPSGGRVEILLLKKTGETTWEALVGGKGLLQGKRVSIEGGPEAEIVEVLDGSRRVVRFQRPLEPDLIRAGHVPLPPYIHTPLSDPERYQTVYADQPGSAAAPTAGLHFTHELMEKLRNRRIQFSKVTLHVGLDTFAPVTEENPEEHQIHTEWCQVTPETAHTIQAARRRGGRIIAVGTTSVRTLESAVDQEGNVQPYQGSTGLFILPGYQFKAVDAIITNFHLPRSTLIMLVSAFAGKERILSAYEEAKRQGYRFYSFGDAMLIF
jgi:S-adenosylmethionine:tRNA ribosyltransferase-isomerase